LEAIGQLMGGVNARDLRHTVMTEAMFEALVRGTRHRSDVVRWWCVQLLDHCPDGRAFDAIVPLLDDPVDRVRRNAFMLSVVASVGPVSLPAPIQRSSAEFDRWPPMTRTRRFASKHRQRSLRLPGEQVAGEPATAGSLV
jgi:hypothetical protein